MPKSGFFPIFATSNSRTMDAPCLVRVTALKKPSALVTVSLKASKCLPFSCRTSVYSRSFLTGEPSVSSKEFVDAHLDEIFLICSEGITNNWISQKGLFLRCGGGARTWLRLSGLFYDCSPANLVEVTYFLTPETFFVPCRTLSGTVPSVALFALVRCQHGFHPASTVVTTSVDLTTTARRTTWLDIATPKESTLAELLFEESASSRRRESAALLMASTSARVNVGCSRRVCSNFLSQVPSQ
ncbi:Structural maintenance of chromosomes protein 1B [Frankliniella fusca]|uniref:Structural maintenance of chromosomes protein 1B n=1 Tax=Frankliniella fusca TaxID=407009 RepID=A0AAE1HSC8_9NEOP|nr:Structural maintenance of chromosomes protein 1B [Frankliniella fusca]